MGQDYAARKGAKKARKRGRQDGSAEQAPKRDRKKKGPRRICRGACYAPPALTEEDKQWNGKEHDDAEEDAAAAADWDSDLEQDGGGSEQLLPKGKQAAAAKQQPKQQPAAKWPPGAAEAAKASKRQKGGGEAGGKLRLSTGVDLLDPKAAAAGSKGAPKKPAAGGDEVPAALQPYHPAVQRSMRGLGFVEPTPVQAACWPAASTGSSMQAVAEPGSGKTLAFLLPACVRLADAGHSGATHPQAPLLLIVEPTRELALQVAAQARALRKSTGLRTTCVYGGAPQEPQVEALSKAPHIVVATPGRLLDLADAGHVALDGVAVVVLDEADKMLSLGFEPQLERLRGLLGGAGGARKMQVLLFTATMPAAVQQAAVRWLPRGAKKVKVGTTADAISPTITQVVHVCAEHKKPAKLAKHLASIKAAAAGLRNPPRVIVFANRVKAVRFVANALREEGYRVAQLHGQRSQAEREAAIAEFRSGKAQVLVATDVAARGLDVRGLPYVVNYEFPSNLETYIHRVGRTGRLAADGHAYSFFTRNLARLAPDLVALLQHHGQAVDPNLAALAEAWRQAEQHLKAEGKPLPAPEPEGSDVEEGPGSSYPAAASNGNLVAEDLHEGLGGGASAAGGKQKGGKKKKGAGTAAALEAGSDDDDVEPGAPGGLEPMHSGDFAAAFHQLLSRTVSLEDGEGPPGAVAAAVEAAEGGGGRKRKKGPLAAVRAADAAGAASDTSTSGVSDFDGPTAVRGAAKKRLRISGLAVATAAAFRTLLGATGGLAGWEGDGEEGDAAAPAARGAKRKEKKRAAPAAAAPQPVNRRAKAPLKPLPGTKQARRLAARRERGGSSGDDEPAAGGVGGSGSGDDQQRAPRQGPGLVQRLKKKAKALPGRLRKKLSKQQAGKKG